jgi:hypothetical protein
MATAPKNGSFFNQMADRVQYGMDHGGPMGAMMGFMGLPYLARGGGSDSAPHGSGPAPFQKMWPGGIDPSMARPAAPTTGGEDPSLAPEDKKRAEMIKAGLPPWYVDWLHTSGQYGGVPPTPGLLG